MVTPAPCPRCGGDAPRGFLFCLACAMKLTDDDPGGGLLYNALCESRQELEEKIINGQTILAELADGPKKERAEAMMATWRRQLAALVYVLDVVPWKVTV